MKKFKFRLQSVLDAREKNLEDRQLEMAIIQQKLKEQNKFLDNLYNKQSDTKSNLEKLIDKGVSIDFTIIKNHQDFIGKLKVDIKNQHKVISDTEFLLEEKKKEVVEALKARDILVKLKEKEQKAFTKEFERQDLIQIDEIALNRHKRKS